MAESEIFCDEIMESYDEDAEAKSYNETNFNEKKATYKTQNFYILLAFFINYYSIIDIFQYLLLFDKILSKRKTFVTISGHK